MPRPVARSVTIAGMGRPSLSSSAALLRVAPVPCGCAAPGEACLAPTPAAHVDAIDVPTRISLPVAYARQPERLGQQLVRADAGGEVVGDGDGDQFLDLVFGGE